MKVFYRQLPVNDLSFKIQSHSEKDPFYKVVTVIAHDITKETKKVCGECLIRVKLKEVYGKNIEIEEIVNM